MIEGQRQSLPECVHHWVIEPPINPQSAGVCKNCDAVRTFNNRDSDNRMWADYPSVIFKREPLPRRSESILLSDEFGGGEND